MTTWCWLRYFIEIHKTWKLLSSAVQEMEFSKMLQLTFLSSTAGAWHVFQWMCVRVLWCPCPVLSFWISFQVDKHEAPGTCPYPFMHLVNLIFLHVCSHGLRQRPCMSPILAENLFEEYFKEIFYIQMTLFFFVPLTLFYQAAVGDMIVQDLRYSPDTKKLLVRLSDTYERFVILFESSMQKLIPFI